MELRRVQKDALEACFDSFREGGTFHLLQAPVAFGKTIFASALIQRSRTRYGARCLFLAHLQELILQTVDKMEMDCGVLMGKTVDIQDVMVGTRQTVSKHLDEMGVLNLIVVDEVHLWCKQYRDIVEHFLALNPRLRVVGVTGTPFTSRGWIYGEGKEWGEPFHESTVDEMIALGYLSKYRYKLADEPDLSAVAMKGSDFDETQLSNFMSEDIHMGSVLHALDEFASDRRRIMVFAVNIEHAEVLAEFLGCDCVHSKLKKPLWRRRVDDFKSGKSRILVNVSQLSIGFDCPEVDCVVMARPTMNAALHVQICGRGLRISEGKEDCLFLDLVGNYLRCGLPSKPKVYGQDKDARAKADPEGRADICPNCLEIVKGKVEICPHCGAVMGMKKEMNEIEEKMRMRDIELERRKPKAERWGEKMGVTTSRLVEGSRFWLVISSREKPLFRFAGNGTKKQEKLRQQMEGLRKGQPVEVVQTGFGDWFK